jgi:Protein of unknown function (DUF2874).
MKKILMIGLAVFLALPFASAKDVITKDVEKLPVLAREFISKYFPDEKISYIEIDRGIVSTTYEVTFVNGIDLEFNKKGEWREVDTKNFPIPAGIVPDQINEFVKQHFEQEFITQIEKKMFRYEIKLSNKMELEFNKKGELVEIDN